MHVNHAIGTEQNVTL